MSHKSLETRLNIIPNIPSRKPVEIFPEYTSIPNAETLRKMYELLERYKPDEQVFWEIVVGEDEKTRLHITDTFLPPAQEVGGVKLDRSKMPGGHTPTQLDALVPSTSIFDFSMIPNSGANDHVFVANFNVAGYSGSHWADHPYPKFAKAWRDKLGIRGTYARFGVGIDMNDGSHYSLLNVHREHDRSRYGHLLEPDVLEIGYALALVANHQLLLRTNSGDQFVVSATSGEGHFGSSRHFLVVQDITKEKDQSKKYGALTRAEDIAKYLLESDSGLPDEIKSVLLFISPDRWKRGTGWYLLSTCLRMLRTDREEVLKVLPKIIQQTTEEILGMDKGDRNLVIKQRYLEKLRNAENDDGGYYELLFSLTYGIETCREIESLVPSSAAVKEETTVLIEKLSDVKVSFAIAQDSVGS